MAVLVTAWSWAVLARDGRKQSAADESAESISAAIGVTRQLVQSVATASNKKRTVSSLESLKSLTHDKDEPNTLMESAVVKTKGKDRLLDVEKAKVENKMKRAAGKAEAALRALEIAMGKVEKNTQ